MKVDAPPGAVVYVDREPKGSAPLQVELPPGAHSVRVRFADGTELERAQVIEAQAETSLVFNSPAEPTGAEAGRTPVATSVGQAPDDGVPTPKKTAPEATYRRQWFFELDFVYDAYGSWPGGQMRFDLPIGRGACVFALGFGLGVQGGSYKTTFGEETDESMVLITVPASMSLRFGFGRGFQLIPTFSVVPNFSKSTSTEMAASVKIGGGLKFLVPAGPTGGFLFGLEALGHDGTAVQLTSGVTF